MSGRSDVQFIKPPNNMMKAKIGDGRVKLDSEAIQRAEARIKKSGRNFPMWAQGDLDGIDQALAAARKYPDQQEECIMQIFRRSMELKALGGSFGYDLISQVGDSLKKYTESRSEANPRDVEIIDAHVNAIRVVLAKDIRGEGGELGRAIVDSLYKLTARP